MRRAAGARAAAALLSASAAAAANGREWPNTHNGIHVFPDQLCHAGSPASWLEEHPNLINWVASHYAGTQKISRAYADALRKHAPGFLVLHYRLGLALGYNVTKNDGSCAFTDKCIEIVDGDDNQCEWPGDDVVKEEWFYQVRGTDNSSYMMCPGGQVGRCPAGQACHPGSEPGQVTCHAASPAPRSPRDSPVKCGAVSPEAPGMYCGSDVLSRQINCKWGWFVMNISVPAYQEWWIGEVLRQLEDNDGDGVFADSFTMPNEMGCGSSYRPPMEPCVDPPREAWWKAAIEAHQRFIVDKFTAKGYKLVPNTGGWITSRDKTDWSISDGVMIESAFINTIHSFAESDYVLQMNNALPLTNAGKILLAQPYDTSTVGNRLFSLASYLILKGNASFISMGGGGCKWFPEYEIPIGSPVETKESMQEYQVAPHVYVRKYTGGWAVVNTNKAASATVTVPKPMYAAAPGPGGDLPDDACNDPSCGVPLTWLTQYGDSATQFTLAATTGAVLLFDAPPPPPALSCPEHQSISSPGLFCDQKLPGAYVACPAAERAYCPAGATCNQTAEGVVDCVSSAAAGDAAPPRPAAAAGCAAVPPAHPALRCVQNGATAEYQICPNGTAAMCGVGDCWATTGRLVGCGAVMPSFPAPAAPAPAGPFASSNDSRVLLLNGRWAPGHSPDCSGGCDKYPKCCAPGKFPNICSWPDCTVNFTFVGTEAGINAVGCGEMDMWVDGKFAGYVSTPSASSRPSNQTTGLVAGLPHGTHSVSVAQRGEHDSCHVFGVRLGDGGSLAASPPRPKRRILCVGDSITAGYGNECGTPSTQNGPETWCPMLGRLFGAEVQVIASSGKGMSKNYNGHPGMAGTMPDLFNRTWSGSATTAWDMGSFVPDLVIVNLGTNDYSTAPRPTPDQYDTAYLNFHKRLQGYWPKSKFIFQCGPMTCPSCWGNKDGCCVRVEKLADEADAGYVFMDCHPYSKAGLVGCAGHPSVAAHAMMANDTAPQVRQVMGW